MSVMVVIQLVISASALPSGVGVAQSVVSLVSGVVIDVRVCGLMCVVGCHGLTACVAGTGAEGAPR